MIFSKKEAKYLKEAQVARLGTIDSKELVHLVPIVFANTRDAIYFVIDRKYKRSKKNLKRIRNISEKPFATLLVDHYTSDWRKLSFLLLYCKAKVLWPGEALSEKRIASRLLRTKYVQYKSGGYFPSEIEKAIFVKIMPRKSIFWQNLRSTVL